MGLGLVQVDDAALNGGSRSLRAVAHSQFSEQAVDVGLYSRFGNREITADLLIAAATHNEL